MKEFQDHHLNVKEYFKSLIDNARFNLTANLYEENWLAPELDLKFDYTQRLIGPPGILCPTGKKWCCSINMTNTLDDGMFAFCPADINIALCPNLDPECILLDNPINSSCALIYCKAKPEVMDFKYVINHIKSRMGDNIYLPESEEIFEEVMKKLNN